jgi:hypothetical protein
MIFGLGWLAGFRNIPDKVGFSKSTILAQNWGFAANIKIYIRSKSISCEYGILYSQMSAGRRDLKKAIRLPEDYLNSLR